MIKKLFTCSVVALSLLMTTQSYGVDKKYAIGVGLNDILIGINGRTKIAKNLFIGGGVYFDNTSGKKVDLLSSRYNIEPSLFAIPVTLDYHPLSGGFKTSFSLAFNNSYLTVYNKSGKNLGKIKLGGMIIPAITIGYDNSLINNDMINLNLAIGLSYRKSTIDGIDNLKADIKWDEPLLGLPMKFSFIPTFSVGIRFNI